MKSGGRRKVLIGILLGSLALLGAWLTLGKPMLAEIDEYDSRIADEAGTSDQLLQREAGYRKAQEDLQKFSGAETAARAAVPGKPAVADFIREIDSLADGSVRIVGISFPPKALPLPNAPKPSEKPGASSGSSTGSDSTTTSTGGGPSAGSMPAVDETEMTVNLRGPTPAVRRWLERVRNLTTVSRDGLRAAGRLVVTHGFEMLRAEEGDHKTLTTLRMKIFSTPTARQKTSVPVGRSKDAGHRVAGNSVRTSASGSRRASPVADSQADVS